MIKAVLGIRDIFGVDQDPDLYLGLTDPDQDQSPDPTPFFSVFKDAIKYCFFHIFSYNLPAVLKV